jgi:hypothetical protein
MPAGQASTSTCDKPTDLSGGGWTLASDNVVLRVGTAAPTGRVGVVWGVAPGFATIRASVPVWGTEPIRAVIHVSPRIDSIIVTPAIQDQVAGSPAVLTVAAWSGGVRVAPALEGLALFDSTMTCPSYCAATPTVLVAPDTGSVARMTVPPDAGTKRYVVRLGRARAGTTVRWH